MTEPEKDKEKEKVRRGVDPSVRGALVLVVVVGIGLLLLAKAAPSSSSTIATRENPGPSVAPTTKPKGAATTSSTVPPTTGVSRPAAQVKVLVLNGTGGKVAKAAGTNTSKLKARGYKTLEPGNAVSRPTSAVYFAPGYRPDAASVADALGLRPETVVPVPSQSVAPNAAQANVVVLLGQDAPA